MEGIKNFIVRDQWLKNFIQLNKLSLHQATTLFEIKDEWLSCVLNYKDVIDDDNENVTRLQYFKGIINTLPWM